MIEPLIQALDYEDGEVREAATEALGKIGDIKDAKVAGVLIQASKDENKRVREAARIALENIGGVPGPFYKGDVIK